VTTTAIDETIAALAAWEALGRRGFTISICYGPIGVQAPGWSVQVLAPNGEEFDQPYAAATFAHAIDIAVVEIIRRWDVVDDADAGKGAKK
jgi:hypothetical protein